MKHDQLLRFLVRPVFLLGCFVILVVIASPKAKAASITVTAGGLQETNTAGSYVTDGDCTLREAIKAANTDAAVDACAAGGGSDTIVLPAGTYDMTGVDATANGLPVITTNVTIQGAGMDSTVIRRSTNALDGDRGSTAPLFRLFEVGSAGTLSLKGVTVRGGRPNLDGGGILSQGVLSLEDVKLAANTLDASGVFGGGIKQVGGSLTIASSVIEGNTSAKSAGGIYATSGTAVTITATSMTNNSTSSPGWGGAVLCDGASTLHVSGSTFSGNAANIGIIQGGFYGDTSRCTMTVADTEVKNNVSVLYGSLNNYYGGSTTFTNVKVHDNTSAGSLLYQGNNSGTAVVSVTNSEFYGNTDHGLWIWESGNATVTGSTSHDNGGAGIRIEGISTDKVKVTQTTAYGNVGMGIDLAAFGSATLNDSGDGDAGPNGILNFPVITRSQFAGEYLHVEGYARPGAAIEIFKSSVDASGFGEGRTYLASYVEGSADDLDGGTGSYGPGAVNGTVVGSDATNKFSFKVPVSLLIGKLAVADKVTSTATLNAQTSEFGNNSAVDGLLAAALSAEGISCEQGVAGSTTTCAFSLPANATLPDGLVLSVGNAEPGGVCAHAEGGATVTCTGVPVGSDRGMRTVRFKFGGNAITESQDSVAVYGQLLQSDVAGLAAAASISCTPSAKVGEKVSCSGTLPAYFLEPSGGLKIGFGASTLVSCAFSGQSFSCKGISVTATVSSSGDSILSRFAGLFVGKAQAADGRHLYGSVGGSSPEPIGLAVSILAAELAQTGQSGTYGLAAGVAAIALAYLVVRRARVNGAFFR